MRFARGISVTGATLGASLIVGAVWFAQTNDRPGANASQPAPSPVIARFDPAAAAALLSAEQRESGVSASQAQVNALADGQLTDAEYKSAVQRNISCIELPFDPRIVKGTSIIKDGGNYTYGIATDFEAVPGAFPDEASKKAYGNLVTQVSDKCDYENRFAISQIVGDRRADKPKS